MTGAHVALLRGVNVGGKNKLSMKELVTLFEGAGCAGVRSYIQSGNVVFRAPAALARRVPKLIPNAIAARFGLQVAVVTRTHEELHAAARANPFLETGADARHLYLMFLATAPIPARVAALDPGRSPPDAFAVVGREIYLYYPNGSGRTRLSGDYFERKLATAGTARNWNTVNRLIELSAP